MRFIEALATTYSIEPNVALAVPLHLAWLSASDDQPLSDGIAVLEAVRRVAGQLTVYVQRGQTQVPPKPSPLLALLEPVLIQVTAPRGGAFHPKLWLLRFADPAGKQLLRLVLLSRNLTADRSWDLSLHLEGQPTKKVVRGNTDLARCLLVLPTLAAEPLTEERVAQAHRLADLLRRTAFEPPAHYDEVKRLHVLGLRHREWRPSHASRMVAIAPFCDTEALSWLLQPVQRDATLISRPETLMDLPQEARARYHCFTLAEAAETEDGEDAGGAGIQDTAGLHAKAFLYECGWRTHLFVGSANATRSALVRGRNVEVLAELVGMRSKVGGVESLLAQEGLGEVLVEFEATAEPPERDPEKVDAERVVEMARKAIADAQLRMRCDPANDPDQWYLDLIVVGGALDLDDLAVARAWPLTVMDRDSASISHLATVGRCRLGAFSTVSLTSLVAFHLVSGSRPDVELRFALKLPVEGMPEQREEALIRMVIRNREGFLRYLLLLLAELDGHLLRPALGQSIGAGFQIAEADDLALVEELIRAYAREPTRLREIGRMVARLKRSDVEGEQIVPEDFLALWQVFEKALETYG
jgi:hypothetical protein